MGEIRRDIALPSAPFGDESRDLRELWMEILPHISDAFASGNQEIVQAIIGYIAVIRRDKIAPLHEDFCNCPYHFMICLKSHTNLCSELLPGETDPNQSCSEEEEYQTFRHQTEEESLPGESTNEVKVTTETNTSSPKRRQKHLKRKRIRTVTEESEPVSGGEDCVSSPQTGRKLKTKRKVIKGVSFAAWAIVPPVMLLFNFLRSSNDNDDEEDKANDPLRPWNYKVNPKKSYAS